MDTQNSNQNENIMDQTSGDGQEAVGPNGDPQVQNNPQNDGEILAHQIPHPGVVCNGCDTAVIGFRYKCIKCPQFNLCSNCERKGIHAGHCMLRIPFPEMAPDARRGILQPEPGVETHGKYGGIAFKAAHGKKHFKKLDKKIKKHKGHHGHDHHDRHDHGHIKAWGKFGDAAAAAAFFPETGKKVKIAKRQGCPKQKKGKKDKGLKKLDKIFKKMALKRSLENFAARNRREAADQAQGEGQGENRHTTATPVVVNIE